MKIASMMNTCSSISVVLFSLTTRIRSGASMMNNVCRRSAITTTTTTTRMNTIRSSNIYNSRAAFQLRNHHNNNNGSTLSFKHHRSSSTLNSSRSSSSSSTSSSQSSLSLPLPSTHPYLTEIKQSLFAIRKACRITTYLQPTTKDSNISGMNKKDASPVTIGDFAVQALVLNLLEKQQQQEGKNVVFIAEEKSQNLISTSSSDDDDEQDLSGEILDIMKQCGYDNIINNVNELKRSIDLGQTYEPNGKLKEEIIINNDNDISSSECTLRTWCLDPIDGTRGFLRGKREGGQYCIALALIEVSLNQICFSYHCFFLLVHACIFSFCNCCNLLKLHTL